MPTLVPGSGPLEARLVVIAEAPAKHEESQGAPLVGPSGWRWNEWLRKAGIPRASIRVDNVSPYRAPGNKFAALPKADRDHWMGEIHRRLAALTDPWLIVPMGDWAVRAILHKSGGITKHRGSIYAYTDARGRTIKAIPVIHPAATLYKSPGWERRCITDWHRIAGDLAFRELRLPEREHFIRPTLADCWNFYFDAAAHASVLTLDIETPRKLTITEVPGRLKKDGTTGKSKWKRERGARRITCIGFAYSSTFSITIPTTEEYWGSREALADAWRCIRALCALPCEKAGQNAHPFDLYWLAQPEYGCPVRAFRWDSRWMHHAMDALDNHSLAYMASIDSREPFWKDDAKDEAGSDDKYVDPDPKSIDDFWRYCGKDVTVTHELVDLYHARLGAAGRLPFYDRHYTALYPVLLRMMLHGIRQDVGVVARTNARLLGACLAIQDKLTAHAGEPLYGPKGAISVKKLARFLYETLKLPKQMVKDKASGVKKATTREVAVRKLMLKHPSVLGRADQPDMPGPLILDFRRKAKLRDFLKEGLLDPDGRLRTAYGFTLTGRLTSSKNPTGTGANLQNQDRELRHVFVPDEGMFFLEADSSQGEDRIVKCLTGAPHLIARARAAPWENDEHKRAAQVIWPTLYARWQDVPGGDHPHRYFGKRSRHGGNYGLHGKRQSEELLKEGYVVTEDEAEAMIQAVLDKDTPEVRDWQKRVRTQVMQDLCIANSWGRVWDFSHDRLSDDLYRTAYAVVPSSELVEIVNRAMVALDALLQGKAMQTRLQHHNHDSLLASTVPDEAYDVACLLRERFEIERTYWGTPLRIPMGLKIGLSWKGDHEFKKFPGREEFDDAVAAMLGPKGAVTVPITVG